MSEEHDLNSHALTQRLALVAALPGAASLQGPVALDGLAENLLEVARRPDGSVAGWALAQLREHDGHAVLRVMLPFDNDASAPLLDSGGLVLRRLHAWRDRHPTTPLSLLRLCADAGSYTLLARIFPKLQPNWSGDEAEAQAVAAAADAFGLQRVSDADPLLRRGDDLVRAAGAVHRYWQRVDSPAAHFFQARVPDHPADAALAVLCPVPPGGLSRSLQRLLRARPTLLPVPSPPPAEPRGRGGPLPPAEAIEQLRRVPLLQGLASGPIERLGSEALRVQVAPGQPVVVAGQPAEGMYIVESGDLAVVLPDPGAAGGELVVDHLSAGDVFGEIGLVMGGTCTATVRAAAPSVLVRVGRETYEGAAAQHPELAEVLWQAAGQRLLANRLLDDGAGDDTAVAACAHAASQAGLLVFEEPEPLLPGHYFVVHGAARVTVGGTWFTVHAGVLFRLGGTAQVSPGGTPLRLLAYPPLACP